MKSYFLKLFAYDCYCNLTILAAIHEVNNPAKAVQLMAHLLTAQQIWYNRCVGLPPVAGTLWSPEAEPGEISAQLIDNNHKAWVSYIEALEDTDFDKTIAYANLSGQPFENKLSDICTQVTNHGTHHRAQIGQHLKLAGAENLPVTDFIFFVRR